MDIVRDVLGNYILSSKLGEFRFRLEILTTFADHIEMNMKSRSEHLPINSSDESSKIIDIVRNFVKYYSQFLGFCDKKIASHYKKSSKEIQEFAKIASWKDVNVYALKNTALKSHRQLNKYIKLYHQELSSPMRDILRMISESSKKVKAITIKTPLAIGVDNKFSIYSYESGLFEDAILDALPKYSERCKSLHQKFRVSRITKLASITNELSVDIIEYLIQFQLENVEIEADKAPRGFKTRRRKALSDLFKVY